MIHDIGCYIEGCGFGTLGETIFLGAYADGADECIALFEYGGLPNTQAAKIAAPGLQVCVRSKDGLFAAAKKLEGIDRALCRIGFEDGEYAGGALLNGRRYFRVAAALSGVTPLTEDENGRAAVLKNYYVFKEEEE